MGARGPDPYETACTHKWDFNKSDSSNVSDSVGTLNATNNGATSTAAYNGAYNYYFEGTDDELHTGTGTTGIGSGDFTIEIIVSVETLATTQTPFNRNNWTSVGYGWRVLWWNNVWQFQNWAASTSSNILLQSAKTDWVAGTVYHLFVTGAPAGGSNNYNLYWMNGTTPTNTAQATFAGSPDESTSTPVYFGKVPWTAYYWQKGSTYLVRIHNAVLTSNQMTQNYKAEGWRYGAYVSLGLTAPTGTTATTTPTFTQATTLVTPTGTTTTSVLSPNITPALVTPTGTTTTTVPTITCTQPTLTAPTATTATDVPTPDVAPALVMPTATTATTTPTQAIAPPILTAPSGTTVTTKPSLDVGSTLTSPTGTTITNFPTFALATTLITPDATTATNAPTNNAGLTLTAPTGTTGMNAMSEAAIVTTLITPTATSATGTLILTQWGAIEVLHAISIDKSQLMGTMKNTDMVTATRVEELIGLRATCELEPSRLNAVSKNTGVLIAISEVIS